METLTFAILVYDSNMETLESEMAIYESKVETPTFEMMMIYNKMCHNGGTLDVLQCQSV